MQEESFLGSLFAHFTFGEDRYYVAVFGEPRADRAWGFRMDGHHLSLNWTILPDGSISATPIFLGGQPREVPEGWEREGFRALREEEEAGRALLDALDADRRARSELRFEESGDISQRSLFLGEGGERLELAEPVGISRGEMTPAVQQRLDALLEVYLGHLARPVRDARMAKVDAAGRDALHFAWSGGLLSGEPSYYRLQGPTLLIEFDNTVGGVGHIHAVIRDVDSDFGRDLLAEHHVRHHASERERRAFAYEHRHEAW